METPSDVDAEESKIEVADMAAQKKQKKSKVLQPAKSVDSEDDGQPQSAARNNDQSGLKPKRKARKPRKKKNGSEDELQFLNDIIAENE